MPGVPVLGALSDLLPNAELVQQMFTYQILGQIISGALSPLVQELQNLVWPIMPDVPLSPADLADMVMRSHIDLATAEAMAKQTGISPENLQHLIDNIGQPPGLTFLLEAYRRGFIPQAGSGAKDVSLSQGIRESRVADKWIPLIEQMGLQPISAADATNAWVRGQISEAEARKILYQNGYDDANATILYDTTGDPPGPSQLIELQRRGIIPMRGTGPNVLSLQQGIYEGSSKDKWEPMFEQLAVYLPPPRTITALERAGVISTAEAQQLYQESGLSATLSAAYSADASGSKVAAAKKLAESTVLELYQAKAIPKSEADTLLADLGYSATEAGYLESVTDLRHQLTLLQSAITKVGSLYLAHKITRSAAVTALQQLGVQQEQVTETFTIWDLELGATVRLLTESQIADAYKYGILDQTAAQQELENIGYTPYDAWVVLSVTMHAAQPNQPPLGPSPSGNVT
ncbi:MAG TPA: hypothetical protein VNF75_03525 [Candidatus Dormibacteraeota bacterium]|nr:hypothetical protein [Candidatus Dormibacteraeota bacterium]